VQPVAYVILSVIGVMWLVGSAMLHVVGALRLVGNGTRSAIKITVGMVRHISSAAPTVII